MPSTVSDTKQLFNKHLPNEVPPRVLGRDMHEGVLLSFKRKVTLEGIVEKTVKAEEHAGRGRDTHVILRGATDVAALALDALPAVGLHCCHHHGGELQARRMPCGGRGQVKQAARDRGEAR